MQTPTKILDAFTPMQVFMIDDLMSEEIKRAEALGIKLTDGFAELKADIERTKEFIKLYDMVNS